MTNDKYYIKIALNTKRKAKERIIAIHQIKEQRVLFKIVMRDDNPIIRMEAVKEITNDKYLRIIAKYDEKVYIRIAAIARIKSSYILYKIAKSNKYDYVVRRQAIERQRNPEYIEKLLKLKLDKGLRKYINY